MNYSTSTRHANYEQSYNQAITKHANTIVKTITFWQQRSKQRRELAVLSDHMLQDIGYNREEANLEASKPFWK